MISRFLSFIRFSHTIFALPFALGSMFVAAHGLPSFRVFALVVLAMVFARTAAMTFNRLVDWEIDKRNPRTAGRHKLVSKRMAIGACLISALFFSATASMINPLCFALSPVALVIVFFYSLTKRFTHGAQFFLGLALAVAPIGAWIAVTGSLAMPPLVLGASVLCWVAGFDIIYATQDLEVDRREGLHSVVVWLGVPRALALATLLHAFALTGFLFFGAIARLGPVYFVGLGLVGVGLVYENLLAIKGTVAAINKAFFQVNAAVSAIFVLTILVDQLVAR
ncbi:MAG: UbiA-like polyprenyltransferase [Terrimicrobium sp.]|jgi:4-hydroxybenzoate polyprenyltransferase